MRTRSTCSPPHGAGPSKRRTRGRRNSGWRVRRAGQTHSEPEPQQKINTILPKGISPYLFFNGERIDNLGRATSSHDIKNAIHGMGLSLLSQTVEDLESPNVADRDSARNCGENVDEAMQPLLNDQERLEHQREKSKKTMETEKEIAALTKEIASIDANLKDEGQRQGSRASKGTRAPAGQDGKLETAIQESKDLKRIISEEGCMLFAADLVREGRRISLETRSEGESRLAS